MSNPLHLSKRDRSSYAADVSPPGWAGTTEAMKSHPEIDNPFALAWSMYEKGDTPHKDADECEDENYDMTEFPAARPDSTGHTGMQGTYGQPRGSEAPTSPALEVAKREAPVSDIDPLDALKDMFDSGDEENPFGHGPTSEPVTVHNKDAGMSPPADDVATQIQEHQASTQEEVNEELFEEQEEEDEPGDAHEPVSGHAVGTIGG